MEFQFGIILRHDREEITYLANLVKTQKAELDNMRQHINLLLTKNFNGEATSE